MSLDFEEANGDEASPHQSSEVDVSIVIRKEWVDNKRDHSSTASKNYDRV